MSATDGFNPLRWDCARQGCFNLVKRPKIELLADCLPGRLAFSDIDGVAEVQGNLLFLEWKEHATIAAGQRILFERLTRLAPATVLIVEGDAEHMEVAGLRIAAHGRIATATPADLDDLRRLIRDWSEWALAHPAWRRH